MESYRLILVWIYLIVFLYCMIPVIYIEKCVSGRHFLKIPDYVLFSPGKTSQNVSLQVFVIFLKWKEKIVR